MLLLQKTTKHKKFLMVEPSPFSGTETPKEIKKFIPELGEVLDDETYWSEKESSVGRKVNFIDARGIVKYLHEATGEKFKLVITCVETRVVDNRFFSRFSDNLEPLQPGETFGIEDEMRKEKIFREEIHRKRQRNL